MESYPPAVMPPKPERELTHRYDKVSPLTDDWGEPILKEPPPPPIIPILFAGYGAVLVLGAISYAVIRWLGLLGSDPP